jgi:hypothetical protein
MVGKIKDKISSDDIVIHAILATAEGVIYVKASK